MIRSFRLPLVVMCGILLIAAGQLARGEENLVRNPTFASPDKQGVPADWLAVKPLLDSAACQMRVTPDGLLINSSKEPFAVGGVWQELQGVKGGQAYAIDGLCQGKNLPSPYRTVTVRVTWTRAGEPLHPAGMTARGPAMTGDKLTFQDVLVAPKEADGAKLFLEVKWPQGGSVCWQRISVCPTTPPPPRKVKIGTVYLNPSNSTPARNMQLFCEQVDAAGKLGLDIVCLGELIKEIGTTQTTVEGAEPIPGPTFEQLAAAAKRNHLWVVVSLGERDGERVYNTGVLIDREGKLKGKYRKIHLPREEWRHGIIPGNEYPVFQTDFGTVGIQVCYDWFFPEITEILAMKGAEIILAPTWGTTFRDEDGRAEGETVFRVRARDNGVYMVPSVYDGNSLVIDPMGRILATSDGKSGLFWHEVDLNQREPLFWVGYWRSLGPRDRMPETYGPLLKDPTGPTY